MVRDGSESYDVTAYGRRYDKLNFKEAFYEKILDTLTKFGKKHVSSYYMRGMTFYLFNQNKKNLVGVEIGVGDGTNSLIICKNLHIKKLYCVDPYCCDSRENSVVGGFNLRNKKIATKKLSRFNVELIEKFSFDSVDIIPNELDFVYIDGCHTYEGVKRDIDLFYPKVKVGGFIGGHDFNKLHFNINKAVVEFAKKNSLEIFTGSYDDWWTVKKGL